MENVAPEDNAAQVEETVPAQDVVPADAPITSEDQPTDIVPFEDGNASKVRKNEAEEIKESIIVEMMDKPAPRKKKRKAGAALKKAKRKTVSAPVIEKIAPVIAKQVSTPPPAKPLLSALPLTPIAPINP